MPTELSQLLKGQNWTIMRPGRQLITGNYLTILQNETEKASVSFTLDGKFISCDSEGIGEKHEEEKEEEEQEEDESKLSE